MRSSNFRSRSLCLVLASCVILDAGGSVLAAQGSYWDLARQVVPAAVQQALGSLASLTTSTLPDDVKPLRMALLHARESLDIFSFAYPAKYTAGAMPDAHCAMDMWDTLRRDLDQGYEVLGNFQDLAHSLVAYNASDVQERLDACLQWLDTILVNRLRYGYDSYAASPTDGKLCKHRHTSKLFWGRTVPSAELTGMENILRLMRGSQVPQIADNYATVLAFEHVYIEPDHTRFHLFRKLVRSVLAVLEFFPEMLPGSAPQDEHLSQALAPAARVHLLDWALDRGAATASSTRRHLRSALQLRRPQYEVGSACDPHTALADLQSLFKNLGLVNNKVFAYEFYAERGMSGKANQAREDCDAAWGALRQWLQQVQLLEVVQCLAAALVPVREAQQ